MSNIVRANIDYLGASCQAVASVLDVVDYSRKATPDRGGVDDEAEATLEREREGKT
jgi:hypothetical protein